MKKSLALFVILISVFSLAFNSCSSDDDESNDPQVATGSFEIYLDDVLFKQGTNAEVGLIKDNQGNYVNTVTIGMGSETGIVVSGFPTTISDVTTMDNDSDPGVNINVDSDYYGTISGTMTRTSASKISFNGTCTKLMEAQVYTITGFVQSTAWEVID